MLRIAILSALIVGCSSVPDTVPTRPGTGPRAGPTPDRYGMLSRGRDPMVPPDAYEGGYVYAPGGPRRGTTAGASVRNDREAEAEVRKKLNKNIERVAWPNIPWKDAVEFLRGETGLNIVPVWSALENEGLDGDRQVTLEAKNLTAGEALDLLLSLVGTGDTPASKPTYYINGSVITITTVRRAAARTDNRPLNVDDLGPIERIPADPNFVQPTLP